MTTIIVLQNLEKVCSWIPLLEAEGWINIEMSIDDYGCIVLSGDKIKFLKKKTYAKPPRRT